MVFSLWTELMARPTTLLPLLALLCSGCFVDTDHDLWKHRDGAPDKVSADLIGDGPETEGPKIDGPRNDGPKPDGPKPDGPVTDGPKPDGPVPDGPVADIVSPFDGGPGTPCTTGGQCQSGHCVDGVCCITACGGPCVACNLLGSKGTCAPVPAGSDPGNDCIQDPINTCGLDGTCDGSGACRNYPVGTVCGTSCTGPETLQSMVCDGAGTCGAGAQISCVPYKCDPTAAACYTSCTSDAQCSRYVCDIVNSICMTSCATVADCQPGYKCLPNGKCS
jgi:hypothetical protein